MLRSLLFILLFSISFQTYCQKYLSLTTYNIDSLLLVLPDQDGEERVNTLNNLAVSLYFSGTDLSTQYAKEALTLAKKLDYREGIAAAYRNFGYINVYLSNYPEALNNFFKSLQIYEELKRKHIIALIYRDIASTHYFANSYYKARDYYLISLNKFRERLEGGTTVGSTRDTINILTRLYLTYWQMGVMIHERLELILKISEVEPQHPNFENTERILSFIEIGANYWAVGEIDSAHKYLDKALEFPDLNQNVKALKHRAMCWKGYLHRSLEEYDTAIFYFDTAYKWYNKIGYLFGAMDLATDLGKIYPKRNDLKMAEKYFKHAELIFNEILLKNSWYRNDSLKNIVFWGLELYIPVPLSQIKLMNWQEVTVAYHGLFQIYEKLKRTDETLKYHMAYASAADTLNRLQSNLEVLELQTRYESDQKERKIEILAKENSFKAYQLKQSRIILFGLAGLVISIIVLAIILIRQNKLREQQKNLLLQQKLFRSQMNPHFLFNSLSSIHNYIIHEESAKAGQYLSKFSKLVRNILDCSVEEYIPLEEEISTIENYLELQKIRFPDKFSFSIEIDDALDPEKSYIPPMLLQPFIENSIEHGFKHKETKGKISVSFSMMNGIMVVDLEDDGIGREKAQEIMLKQNIDHKSLATAITYERIRVLNKKLKKKIALNILDLKNEKEEPTGTRVTFEIPVLFS
ncbi:MAG: histidine kinase [Bacteroidales bacterium]|nr:histidine kinase [Bacteroidales bacterium]